MHPTPGQSSTPGNVLLRATPGFRKSQKTKDKWQKSSRHQRGKLQSAVWNFGLDCWSFFGPCYLSFGISAQRRGEDPSSALACGADNVSVIRTALGRVYAVETIIFICNGYDVGLDFRAA
jgi:hypothetical protein